MSRSESIKELALALSKAQAVYEHAKKDVTNDFFKNRYADLASCIDAAKRPLSDNGLSVTQITDSDETGLYLETILMHISGEWISGRYPIRPIKNDPQAFGSAMTYARRYAFSAITGIAADDDDGNTASQQKKEPVKKEPVAEKKPPESDGIDYSEILNNAENLQQLIQAWQTIPKTQHYRFIELKDNLKSKFMELK